MWGAVLCLSVLAQYGGLGGGAADPLRRCSPAPAAAHIKTHTRRVRHQGTMPRFLPFAPRPLPKSPGLEGWSPPPSAPPPRNSDADAGPARPAPPVTYRGFPSAARRQHFCCSSSGAGLSRSRLEAGAAVAAALPLHQDRRRTNQPRGGPLRPASASGGCPAPLALLRRRAEPEAAGADPICGPAGGGARQASSSLVSGPGGRPLHCCWSGGGRAGGKKKGGEQLPLGAPRIL